jgi:hypothetical protein
VGSTGVGARKPLEAPGRERLDGPGSEILGPEGRESCGWMGGAATTGGCG